METQEFYSFSQKKVEVDIWIYAVEIITYLNMKI